VLELHNFLGADLGADFGLAFDDALFGGAMDGRMML